MRGSKVLFIGGAGRSGSTLIDNAVGQIPGLVAVGELNEFWKARAQNRLCGCGRSLSECEFWRPVVTASFGDVSEQDVRRIVELQDRVARWRRIPKLAIPTFQERAFRRQLAEYVHLHGALLEGIRRFSDAEIVVDSSKTPSQLFLTNRVSGVRIYVVHLVRDSRAVAYSWMREKLIPDASGQSYHMSKMSPLRSSIDWNARNFLMGVFKRSRAASMESYDTLRYEDLTSAPDVQLSRIVKRLLPGADVRGIFDADTVNLERVTHTIEGNPAKFRRGRITVRLDEEWKRRMRPIDRAIVTALTYPYLRKFGYL